jgi:hypothetical protein
MNVCNALYPVADPIQSDLGERFIFVYSKESFMLNLFSNFLSLSERGIKGKRARSSASARRSTSWQAFSLVGVLLVMSMMLIGCSLFGESGDQGNQGTQNGGGSATTVPPADPVALNKLHWCKNKSSEVFIDGSSASAAASTPQAVNLGPANGTPVAIKDWNTLKANLGFSLFLPETLPAGSCLLSATGTVRNAVMGSNFVLTYMLPNAEALTISQASQHTQNKTLQCSVSDTGTGGTPTPTNTATALPLQVCSGVRDATNITFSARWKTEALQQFFANLKQNQEWKPTV